MADLTGKQELRLQLMEDRESERESAEVADGLASIALSQDKRGREHKGKGPGGGQFAKGSLAKMGPAIGSKLGGQTVTVQSGPHTVQGMSGVYSIRGDDGTEEQVHGSRLWLDKDRTVEDAQPGSVAEGKAGDTPVTTVGSKQKGYTPKPGIDPSTWATDAEGNPVSPNTDVDAPRPTLNSDVESEIQGVPGHQTWPDRIKAWAQREFNAKYVEAVAKDLMDVAAGNREGNTFEKQALAHIFPEGRPNLPDYSAQTEADRFDYVDIGEGPWVTEDEARDFAEAEVGEPWDVQKDGHGFYRVMIPKPVDDEGNQLSLSSTRGTTMAEDMSEELAGIAMGKRQPVAMSSGGYAAHRGTADKDSDFAHKSSERAHKANTALDHEKAANAHADAITSHWHAKQAAEPKDKDYHDQKIMEHTDKAMEHRSKGLTFTPLKQPQYRRPKS